MVEFTKLIENQNLISIAQNTILAKLGSLEPEDTISNSGLNEEECVSCPEIGPIQPSNQLQPELKSINTKLQGYLTD